MQPPCLAVQGSGRRGVTAPGSNPWGTDLPQSPQTRWGQATLARERQDLIHYSPISCPSAMPTHTSDHSPPPVLHSDPHDSFMPLEFWLTQGCTSGKDLKGLLPLLSLFCTQHTVGILWTSASEEEQAGGKRRAKAMLSTLGSEGSSCLHNCQHWCDARVWPTIAPS
jgi:hypothetical protein